MTGHLGGKVALVTGASSGLGGAIADRLSRAGANVVVHYGGARDGAEAVAKRVRANGAQAHLAAADLADAAAIPRLLDEARAAFGGLDILVLNAGAPLLVKPLADTTVEEYDRLFAVNARATFLLLKHAAGALRDGGRVVGFSTPYVAHAEAERGAVAASKAALQALVLASAKEWGGRGITANCVMPGATDTGGFRQGVPEQAVAGIVAQTPLGRLGRPEDIADAVAFLCSEKGRWITGQVLPVNGGLF